MHSLRESVFTPESLVPLAIGVGGGILAGYGQDGAVIGMYRTSSCLTSKIAKVVSVDLSADICRCCCWCCSSCCPIAISAADRTVHLQKAHTDPAGGH